MQTAERWLVTFVYSVWVNARIVVAGRMFVIAEDILDC